MIRYTACVLMAFLLKDINFPAAQSKSSYTGTINVIFG